MRVPVCSRLGVLTASSAPALMASKTLDEFRFTLAVTTTMAQGFRAMIRRVASTPSISGMIKSISTRSGVSRAQRSTASAPSRATQASSWPRASSRRRRIASTAITMSLTIAILMLLVRRSNP